MKKLPFLDGQTDYMYLTVYRRGFNCTRVTLIREINLISRNQLPLTKPTYKNIILNNYAKILPEY